MFRWGINLLFVVFAELLYCITFMRGLMGGSAVIVVFIFLIEFTIVGYLIYNGYMEEIDKEA